MRFLATLLFCFAFSALCAAQDSTKRIDHLTVEEDELIHEAQELDLRTQIFVKAIDRRLMSLNGNTTVQVETADKAAEKLDKKLDKKLDEKLGALPAGTRAELLADINSIVAEAISKIDDQAGRNPKNPALLKSLKILADGCARFVVQLKTFDNPTSSSKEREAVADSIQNCQEVLDAQRKQPASATK